MKNKILIIFFSLLFFDLCFSKNIFIEAKNITIEQKNEISIFKKNVLVKTEDNYEIKSQYGEYNKKSGILILKENVEGIDKNNNIIETEFAKYNEI